VFVREHRHEVLAATFPATLTATERAEPGGKAPVAAGLLALAPLVPASWHVGDRDAVDLTGMDKRWQRVLDGLGAEPPPLSQRTLGNCRRRLMAHTRDKSLLERPVTGAEQPGGLGARHLRAAVDSTPLCGAGRVAATLHLRGQAWRKAGGRAARALGVSAAARREEAGWGLGGPSSRKAALDLDWGQPQAREPAPRLGLAAVARWTTWLEQPPRRMEEGAPLKDVMDTIAPLVTQDTAPDPAGGPGGPRRQTPGAPARRLSRAEADMRHGRKSRAKTCHGLPAHCGLDWARQVPRAVVVRPAPEPAHAAVARLVETLAQPPGLLQRAIDLGDRASPRLTPGAAPGVSSMARPWPQGGPRFTKDAFTCDFGPGQVTCPGGQTVPMVPGQDAQFPASACDRCPPRAQCPTARRGPGRSLAIRADAQLQPKLRAKSKTKRGRAALRKRTAVAPAIFHHIAHQGRRAREKGLRKNPFDGRRHAAVSHLQGAAHDIEERPLAS